MVLSMPRPFKHPKTGVYYFRQKTPADLRAIFGKGEAGWSLDAKDPEEAKRLNAGAVQQQAAMWDRLRKRPEPLPHKQIVAFSGTLWCLNAMLQVIRRTLPEAATNCDQTY